MNFNQILAEYGITGLAIVALISVILLAARALFGRSNSDTKQDETIRELLVALNEERKVAQERERKQLESNNHLSAELTALKVERGTDAGKLIEIKESMQRERDEWKAERAESKRERLATDSSIREMQTSILDLQKNQRDNQAKIRDLEGQVETLNQRIADKDGEISTHLATIARLQAEIAQLLEQNTELRSQVDERNARVDNLSQLVKLGNEAETPPAPADTPVSTGNTQAIPDMRSVDDTVTPIPRAGTTLETNVNEPPQSSAA